MADAQPSRDVLALVLAPDTWPGYRLAMKRIADGQTAEHGWIGRIVRPDFILVRGYDGERVLGEFGSIEGLAAAGWAFD